MMSFILENPKPLYQPSVFSIVHLPEKCLHLLRRILTSSNTNFYSVLMIALLVTSAACRSSPSLLVYQKGEDPHRTQGQPGSVPHWSHLKVFFGFGFPPQAHNHNDDPHGPECLISAAQPLCCSCLLLPARPLWGVSGWGRFCGY